MSEFLLKSLIACILLVLGVAAFLNMMAAHGRPNPQAGPERYDRLRRRHRAFGYAFAVLLLPQIYLGLDFLAEMGDAVAARGALHYLVAELMIVLVLVKILVARRYRGLLKWSPGLGLGVTALLLATFVNTAGFYFLRAAERLPLPSEEEAAAGREAPEPRPEKPARNDATGREAARAEVGKGGALADAGALIFSETCSGCHSVDRFGGAGKAPGLKGIFTEGRLPATGRPATDANVESQIRDPVGPMPAFKNLTDEDIDAIVAYLRTLR